MRTIKFFLLLTVIIFSQLEQGNAQLSKEEKAEMAYNAGEYYDAIVLFKEAYQDIVDRNKKNQIIYKIALCYRKTSSSNKAQIWFKKVLGKKNIPADAYLFYADALKMNQMFEEALTQYKAYSELAPNDERGKRGAESCELAQKWLANPSGYQVASMKYFNSKQSDYSPVFANADYSLVYFTSTREEAIGGKTHGATGEDFSDIFETRKDRSGKWSKPTPLEESINSVFEEGSPSMNSNYTKMYFSKCRLDKRDNLGCQIFVTSKQGEMWGKTEQIPIAADSIVVAHPSISDDELTLYFASDMSGGKGGTDIWKITRESSSGEWGQPENLGDNINTPGREVFPFIHQDGTLYFSSDYHLGMGGLDIFKATKNEIGAWQIENMRYPVNSTEDDFGIVYEKEKEMGYFTSNRKGSRGDDIYSFYLPPLKYSITGTIKDEKTEAPIPQAITKLVGSDGTTLNSEADADGYFKFMLKPNTDYIVIASKEGYLKNKAKETTKGVSESKEYHVEISLSPIDKPIDLPNIFYDFNKADLRPESMVALDVLVETLNDNPNVTIELRSHTDARGSDKFNNELSQKRAQSVVNYLIEKGIDKNRLVASGQGKRAPKIVDKKIVKQYPYFRESTELTEEYINSLPSEEQQEIAHQINRRTDFQVLSTDYTPGM